MELQKIREAFPTARILVGRNGVVISYPRVASEYANDDTMSHVRTSSIISRYGEKSVFAEMISKCEKFGISVSYSGGLRFLFSMDGNKISIERAYKPLERQKTYGELMAENPPENPNRFIDAYAEAEGTPIEKFFAALRSSYEEEDNVYDIDEIRRWKELHSLSIELNEKFRGWDVNLYDYEVEYLFGSEENRGVILSGLQKDYFERMVRISNLSIGYGIYTDKKITSITMNFTT